MSAEKFEDVERELFEVERKAESSAMAAAEANRRASELRLLKVGAATVPGARIVKVGTYESRHILECEAIHDKATGIDLSLPYGAKHRLFAVVDVPGGQVRVYSPRPISYTNAIENGFASPWYDGFVKACAATSEICEREELNRAWDQYENDLRDYNAKVAKDGLVAPSPPVAPRPC